MLEFENDVETYGTQTAMLPVNWYTVFENDVETYGTQTVTTCVFDSTSLRMMQKRMVLKPSDYPYQLVAGLRMMQKRMVLKRLICRIYDIRCLRMMQKRMVLKQ